MNMATIKSFTSLEQSRKLAEILPLESADMYYSHEFVNSAGDYYKINIASEGHFDDKELLGSDIPAWSLAALLSVLPETVRLVGTSKDSYWYCECVNGNNQWYAGFGNADNPVDACAEIIIKLHELKML